MSEKAAVVMAAGKGTRMGSALPKVLIPVHGRPMIEYVIDALTLAGVDRIIAVVGYQADMVREQLAGRPRVSFALQEPQRGTGHAVMMCRDQLAEHRGPVLVVAGDSPMMQSDSIAAILGEWERTRAACILGTGTKADPTGLGRVVRDSSGRFASIVEEKDATPEQRRINEVNLSTYVFDTQELLGALEQIQPNNSQGEYYLTDVPAVLQRGGKEVQALNVLKPCEALSINTMAELAAVEEEMLRLGMTTSHLSD
jgi:bifunctional UDP-N-acetylglucosamine pyrophosphorylase/glucosamine-1-phosphate N-acetyltransferase/UDP-N-acetylglucosamine pyrophosphorylase